MTSDRGFTLVETLVALVIVGLVMTLVLGGLRFLADRDGRKDNVLKHAEGLASVQELLRREAAAAVRFAVVDANGVKTAFIGLPDELAMIVEEPPQPSGPGLAVVVLSIEASDSGTRLRFRRIPYAGDAVFPNLAQATEDVTIASLPGSPRFDYAGVDADGASIGWRSPWDEPLPPNLIRLTGAPQANPWPEIIVPYRADAEPACLLDTVSLADRTGCSFPRAAQ